MSQTKKSGEAKKKTPPRQVKPRHPHTEGAPDDRDPKAQYEEKDES